MGWFVFRIKSDYTDGAGMPIGTNTTAQKQKPVSKKPRIYENPSIAIPTLRGDFTCTKAGYAAYTDLNVNEEDTAVVR